MVGIEIVHHREGTATLIHSSIQELTPLHEFEAGSRVDLCKVKGITASTPYVISTTDTLHISILLVRKKDSKIAQLLADEGPAEFDDTIDNTLTSFFYGSMWSTPVPGAPGLNGSRDTDAYAALMLTAYDEPVEHCKGRGPAAVETVDANTWYRCQCPCGHATEQELQQHRLRGGGKWKCKMIPICAMGCGF